MEIKKYSESKREKKIRIENRLKFRKELYKYCVTDEKVEYPSKKRSLFNLKTNVKELGEDEKISCLVDKAFKTLIMNEQKPERLAFLISSVFDVSFEDVYNNLVFVKNELDKDKINDKAYRSDGVLRYGLNGFIFETNRTAVEERNIRYLDTLSKSEVSFNGERLFLSLCALFNINDFKYPGHDEPIEIYSLNDGKNLLTFCKFIINIYISNIVKKYYNKIELSDLERMVLVMNTTSIKFAKEIAKDNKIMLDLIEDSIRLKDDEAFLSDYEDKIIEYQSIHDSGYEEGHEEGREEGINLGQTTLIKNMLDSNISLDDISRMTKLSKKKLTSLLNN